MKKGKINFICLLFSAVIGTVLFYAFVRWLFMFGWNFNLLSEKHWLHVVEKWQSGWVIRKPKEVLFFLAVLSLIPGLLASWFIAYIFPWKRFFLFPKTYFEKKKKERLQAQSLAAATGPANIQDVLAAKKNPEKVIKLTSEKLHQIDHLRGKSTTGNVASSSVAESAPAVSVSKQSRSIEDEAALRFDLWENLADSLKAQNIFILREMKIKNFSVNTLAITQEGVFLLCEGPAQGNTWEIQEDEDPPVWKTEKEEIPSPLRPLVDARNALRDYIAAEMPNYAHLNVNGCMVLDHGSVVNTDHLLTYLEEWDISVLRMGSCHTETLPDTHALIEYIKSQPVSTQAVNDAVAIAILDLMESEDEE